MAILITTAQQRIEATLGSLITQNATLAETIESQNIRIGDLEKQLAEANEKLAKKKTAQG